MFVTVRNVLDRPTQIDAAGHLLAGGDYGTVVDSEPVIVAALASGRLRLVADPGGSDLSALVPAAAAAIFATRAANGAGTPPVVAAAPAALLIGTGVPDPSVGSVGSRYQDETSGLVYGPKTAAGWGVGRQLGNGTFAPRLGLGERLRRAAAEARVRNSLLLGVMTSPPTITTGISGLDATLTKVYRTSTGQASSFRVTGGTPAQGTGGYVAYISAPSVTMPSGSGGNKPGDGTRNQYMWSVVAVRHRHRSSTDRHRQPRPPRVRLGAPERRWTQVFGAAVR